MISGLINRGSRLINESATAMDFPSTMGHTAQLCQPEEETDMTNAFHVYSFRSHFQADKI